ncbi:MAG: DUF5615 family PIN-like protein [Chloroflexia bacterium]
MRILLDECVPRPLRNELPGHDVRTVRQMGWLGTENGDLLRLAETTFDIFVTVDQNLPYQQNASDYDIAVVVLAARSNRLQDLQPLMVAVLQVLEMIQLGTVIRIAPDAE